MNGSFLTQTSRAKMYLAEIELILVLMKRNFPRAIYQRYLSFSKNIWGNSVLKS